MFRSFFASWKWAPFSYGCVLLLAVLFYYQVETSSRLGEWMQILGNIVSGSKDYSPEQFLDQFVYEALRIAGILVYIQASIDLVSSGFCWGWYEAMTSYFLPNWNKTLREVDSPSQRMEVSLKAYPLKFLTIAKAIFRSVLVLFKFGPIIWVMSDKFDFFYFSQVPGKLVWIVLVICLAGLAISAVFGMNLKICQYDINDAEGLYRSALEFVQRNKNREDSMPMLMNLMKNLRKKNIRLFYNKFWYNLWIGFYGQIWAVLPITFFAYNVFSGVVKYGIVAKTSYALGEVIGALSMPIWLYEGYTEMKSVEQRIKELERSVNDPKNWEEPKKEEGWEDRRLNVSGMDINGQKIEISREELKKLLEEISKDAK